MATQASTRTEYGNELLDALAKGEAPADALKRLLAADSGAASRQVGVIDIKGRSAQHTGTRPNDWKGHRAGPNYVTQGNVLVSILIVLFGFFFATVSSRITGLIGSSSNPISGMTIATLIITCVIFVALGWTGDAYAPVAISVGAEVMYLYFQPDGDGFAVYPTVAFQWSFYIGERWSIFPEIGAMFLIAPMRERFFPSFIAPLGAVGVRWHFSENNALLFRIGWPCGAQIGLVFEL